METELLNLLEDPIAKGMNDYEPLILAFLSLSISLFLTLSVHLSHYLFVLPFSPPNFKFTPLRRFLDTTWFVQKQKKTQPQFAYNS